MRKSHVPQQYSGKLLPDAAVESPKAQDILVDVGAGNGIEIYLNGKSVMKHLNPYRCKFREEKVLLPLQKAVTKLW